MYDNVELPSRRRRGCRRAALGGTVQIDRSELLREALHRHLVRLRTESDVDTWQQAPLSDDEQAIGEIADWGPAKDWSDWADAAG